MIFPVFTKINSDERLMNASLSLNGLIIFFIIPFTFINLFYTDTLISTIYGANWSDAIPFVKLLCLLLTVRLLRNLYKPILISRGLAKDSFFYSLITSFLTTTTLAIFIIYFSIETAITANIILELFLIFVLTYLFILSQYLKFILVYSQF